MRQRIVSIFSGKTNESWFRCKRTEIVTIHGFIGKPEFAKKQRRTVFFVNDRFIKAVIHHAIMAAYDGFTRRRTT
jgi:DNA mismatch repair protein MutL